MLHVIHMLTNEMFASRADLNYILRKNKLQDNVDVQISCSPNSTLFFFKFMLGSKLRCICNLFPFLIIFREVGL